MTYGIFVATKVPRQKSHIIFQFIQLMMLLKSQWSPQNNSIFCTAGSVQSSEDRCLADIKRHIALASSVMTSLKKIWRGRVADAYRCPSKSKHIRHLFSSPFCMPQRHGPDVSKSFQMKCQRHALAIGGGVELLAHWVCV